MRVLSAAVFVVAGVLPAWAQDVGPVRAASQRFTSALSGGDASGAGALLAEDAVLLPPGRDMIQGKAPAQAFLGRMATHVQDLRYTSEDIRPIGEGVAREVGSFSLRTQGQNGQEVKGKYLFVWVKTGADWRLSTDMWNRSGGGQGRQGMGGGRKGRRGGAPDGGGQAPADID